MKFKLRNKIERAYRYVELVAMLIAMRVWLRFQRPEVRRAMKAFWNQA